MSEPTAFEGFVVPKNKISIALDRDTPTKLTVELLQKQLAAMGHNCSQTNLNELEVQKQEVLQGLARTTTQAFGITPPGGAGAALMPHGSWKIPAAAPQSAPVDGSYAALLMEAPAVGKNALGFAQRLAYICDREHFDYLVSKKQEFRFDGKSIEILGKKEKYSSAQAIKVMFKNAMLGMSSIITGGIDRDSLEAAVTNVISPMTDANAVDYKKEDSLMMYLVDNYNETTGECDGLGVVTAKWKLLIENYKEKKSDARYSAKVDVWAWGVYYTGSTAPEDINRHVANVFAKFPQTVKPEHSPVFFGAPAPPPAPAAAPATPAEGFPVPGEAKLEIFDKKPPAISDTWRKSLPIKATSDGVDVLVLYYPSLKLIGTHDSTGSKVSGSITKSTGSGFAFSSTQSITVGATVKATILLASINFSVEIGVSFTEEQSKTESVAYEMQVPAGEKGFLYQGTLKCQILRYDPKNGSFSYFGPEGSYLTDTSKTTDNPIKIP